MLWQCVVVSGQVTNVQAVNTAATNASPGAPGLDDYLTGTGPEQSYEESTKLKMQVSGYRRYF